MNAKPTVSLHNHYFSIGTECPSSMSEETIGSDKHERVTTSVQVHLAVTVRVVAGALKVDYLVTLQITKHVSSRPPRHLLTAHSGHAIPA